ncbi:MAG: signal peptide peptidase SppA [Bacteroidota bacterium]|jgi:protease-4
MKQFFKTVLASMLGVFLSTILIFLLFLVLVVGIVASTDGGKTGKVEPGTILHIELSGEIAERHSENPFSGINPMSLSLKPKMGLDRILESLDKASRDPNIKGIYLDVSSAGAGMATMEEIRVALDEFKKSKKFIYSYSDVYGQGDYYLASVSDKIWMNPEGALDFRGMSAAIPFFKGSLEKLEVKPEIIRHGKFKSAVEPFMLDRMSDENRAQTASYVNALWSHYLKSVSTSRKIPLDTLSSLASNLNIRFAKDALSYGMVDTLAYKDGFLDELCKKTGKKDLDDLELITISSYHKVADPGPEKEPTRDKVAVIYAVGDIVAGKGVEEEIGGEGFSKIIRKVRMDDKIKAVVLRVNSPGGDALASDIIWRELELCRKVKPVMVSMGDVAASGGYYISCNADSIFAQPNTITGSIGVFGLMFNLQDMLRNKLGVTIDTYSTGTYADMGSMTRPLTESEKSILQSYVEQVYGTFIGKVSQGRGISVADVDSIGQGRVWSGVDAHKLGLVDALGGLQDAIDAASKKAKLKNYRVVNYPEAKDPFKQLIDEMSGASALLGLSDKFGVGSEFLDLTSKIQRMRGVQARYLNGNLRY